MSSFSSSSSSSFIFFFGCKEFWKFMEIGQSDVCVKKKTQEGGVMK